MKDSEQAQAIEEILHRHDNTVLTWENETQPGEGRDAHNDRSTLLEIVDSQAQKIADLNRVGSNTLLALIESQQTIAEQADTIGRYENSIANLSADVLKQAKEIDRLKKLKGVQNEK